MTAKSFYFANVSLAIFLLGTSPAFALTLNVTTTADELDSQCDTHCSLRDAIRAASAVSEENVINLPAGTYVLSRVGSNENHAVNGDLDITGKISIVGNGGAETIIDGHQIDRVFHVLASGELKLQGITIRHGNSLSSSFPCGGGILNNGTLTLVNSHVVENVAASGGGICNRGTLSVVNSPIINNLAKSGNGGGIETDGSVVLDHSDLQGNQAMMNGGGIDLSGGTVSLKMSQITKNTALQQGGGTWTGDAKTFAIIDVNIMDNQAPVGKDCLGILVPYGNYNIGETKGCQIIVPTKPLVSPPTIQPIQPSNDKIPTGASDSYQPEPQRLPPERPPSIWKRAKRYLPSFKREERKPR